MAGLGAEPPKTGVWGGAPEAKQFYLFSIQFCQYFCTRTCRVIGTAAETIEDVSAISHITSDVSSDRRLSIGTERTECFD